MAREDQSFEGPKGGADHARDHAPAPVRTVTGASPAATNRSSADGGVDDAVTGSTRDGHMLRGSDAPGTPQSPPQSQLQSAARGTAAARATTQSPSSEVPQVVAEEQSLLRVVLNKLDQAPRRIRTAVDDAGSLIELRDALAEAKPEDQGSILEQMHRIEALSRQRGKGESPPVDRKSPYFGHLRLEENGRRRDVLIGTRSFVEPGGGVQIVDWRHAPVSQLFYRYEEGDSYEERLGDRVVEGEVLARRTVAIVDAELRRVSAPQGTFARDRQSGGWREVGASHAKLQVARDGTVTMSGAGAAPGARGGTGAQHARGHRPGFGGKGTPTGTAPSTTTGTSNGPAGVRDEAAGPRGRLGLDDGGSRRVDRHLPAIAALIDPRQFELITRPSSGLIAVQGSAGSGKTTIGLHRIAYLAFADPKRFRPDRMLIVVYQKALATYVSRVLPELDVPGVPVRTFADWAEEIRRATFPALQAPLSDETPPLVMRAKSHGAMLKILAKRQAELAAWCRSELAREVGERSGAEVVLAFWDATAAAGAAGTTAAARAGQTSARPGTTEKAHASAVAVPVDARVTALARWVRDSDLDPTLRHAVESAGKRLRQRTRDVVGEWASFFTDRHALGAAFGEFAPGLFSPGQLDDIHRYCVARERLRTSGADPQAGEVYALDVEDDALLLRIHQLQRGELDGPKGPLAYEHLMVDEVQDFSPMELAVLLDATSRHRSVTLAGDTAQAIAPDHGFTSWAELLDDLAIPHDRVEPLRVSYRSTREIVEVAEHVLGPLMGDIRPVAPRTGAPVEAFGFASAGEATEFLAHALKELVRSEPTASVALIARHVEQARLYYEALSRAEVPSLRLVDRQNFTFSAGIDVTDVRQTKGLEFDIVILLEATQAAYPASDDARRLLHVAITRAAHQLWITYTSAPSPLLPAPLLD